MNFFKKGINGFTIKMLALIFMTFDHIAAFMPETMQIPIWFHWIGRISAPLFTFMAVEGFYHTSNRKKYITRLYIWSVIMAIGNQIINSVFPHPEGVIIINNIFSTIFLIAIYLQAIEFIKKFRKEREVKYLIIGLTMIIAPIILGIFIITILFKSFNELLALFMTLVPVPFLVEGGPILITLGIIFYLCREKKLNLSICYILMCIFVFITMANGDFSLKNSTLQNYQWMMVASLPFMLLYNREKGKSMKYLFYLYYPAHIYVLYILGIYLI
ncbi:MULTISPECIES: TraX family protein [Clostridioides]|uniref:TraX family protein n=1 Tax=Clostridioides sp. ZZV14-6387 TaxID=2811497 RepID=UPI0016B7022A|nr:conjugal transfer protein TraX [Clostridioides sp. ZZV14-6387]NJI82476.1 conjugal transfer protein TraX [Clostridioides difficile]